MGEEHTHEAFCIRGYAVFRKASVIDICRGLCTVVTVCDVEVRDCREHLSNLCDLFFCIYAVELVKVSAFGGVLANRLFCISHCLECC